MSYDMSRMVHICGIPPEYLSLRYGRRPPHSTGNWASHTTVRHPFLNLKLGDFILRPHIVGTCTLSIQKKLLKLKFCKPSSHRRSFALSWYLLGRISSTTSTADETKLWEWAGFLESELTRSKRAVNIIADYKRKIANGGFIKGIFDPEVLSPASREFSASVITHWNLPLWRINTWEVPLTGSNVLATFVEETAPRPQRHFSISHGYQWPHCVWGIHCSDCHFRSQGSYYYLAHWLLVLRRGWGF